MAQNARTQLEMRLSHTGQFTRLGSTQFTFRGNTLQEGIDKVVTLSIPMVYVSNNADVVELSLLSPGQSVVFDVRGQEQNDLFEIDRFFSVTHV